MQNVCHKNKSCQKDEVRYNIILNHQVVFNMIIKVVTHVSTKSKTFEVTFEFLDETFLVALL
jgi:hypothetical protein